MCVLLDSVTTVLAVAVRFVLFCCCWYIFIANCICVCRILPRYMVQCISALKYERHTTTACILLYSSHLSPCSLSLSPALLILSFPFSLCVYLSEFIIAHLSMCIEYIEYMDIHVHISHINGWETCNSNTSQTMRAFTKDY